MKSSLLCLLLTGCQLSPEGRAIVAANLQAQAQRDHQYGMHHSAMQQQALHGPFQRRYDAPTYYARPDPLTGGTIIGPNRYGF